MKNLMKKTIVSIVTLSTIAMMTPALVGGATVEELQAQIASLTAQLATLQAQLTAMGGGTAAGTCTFTRALYPGVSGADVKCLQQYLNGAGFAVAASGAGSAGNETQYYGPLTQAAVKKWQDANGVVYGAYGGYFGPVSQAKYNSLGGGTTPTTPAPGITTPGAEGSMVATIAGTPASGTELYLGQTGVAVAAVNVKATGSDILVNRFDASFAVRPWLYISGLTVTDGTTSKSMSVTQANTTEVTVGSSYLVRLEGLNILIPKDTTKTLTVKVDGVSALPSGTTSDTTVTLTIAASALRGVDGAGIQQYAPTGILTRTFKAKVGDTAALELSASADNPKARNAIVSESGMTTGVEILRVNVKAKNNTAYLRTVEIGVTSSTLGSSEVASGTVSAIYLYDGDTILASTSSLAVNVASATFSDVNLTIPKDGTKTLVVKADINKTVGNFAEGDVVVAYLEANSAGLSAEDATTFAAATVSGSGATSGAAYLYAKAPALALVSASITPVSVSTGTESYYGKADAKIKINITAQGGDIYVASSTTNDYVATSTYPSSVTVLSTISSNATETSGNANWVVYSGETKWFEFYDQLTRENDGGALPEPDISVLNYMVQLLWRTSDSGAVAASWTTQSWGLTDFKTGYTTLAGYR